MVRIQAANSLINSALSNSLGGLQLQELSGKELSTFCSIVAQQQPATPNSLAFYELLTPSGDRSGAPVAETLCVVKSTETAFVEVKRPVVGSNKEGFTNVLDFVAQQECSRMVACVDKKNANFKNTVASLLAIGFAISRQSSTSGFTLLEFEL